MLVYKYCKDLSLFQNFDYIPYVDSGKEGFYGGSVSLADYCPYIQEFTWRSKNVIVRGSHCEYKENNPSKCSFRILKKIYEIFIVVNYRAGQKFCFGEVWRKISMF